MKCPNSKECNTICNIGYACDGCPYNEEYKMKCPICEKELIEIKDVFEVNAPFGKMKGVIYECCDRQIIQQNLIKEDLC